MAKNAVTIGMKYVVGAKFSADGTYADGKKIGQAMTAKMASEFAEAQLYADDCLVDSTKEFTKGTISIGITQLDIEDYAFVLGHEYDKNKGVEFNANDVSPIIGLGFYCKAKNTFVTPAEIVYRAYWFKKVKFSDPGTEVATKGGSIEYKTQTLEGVYMPLENGSYHIFNDFEKEEEAIAWLNGQAGIPSKP